MPPIVLPTLRDGDLILRPKAPGDADAVTAACRDPEIPRWTQVPSPYTRAHAVEYLARVNTDAAAGTAVGLHAVDPDGALLGSFALMELDREPGYGEIGYWVVAEARGRGVATRAVRLLTGWGHDALGLRRIEILTHRDNLPSQRVAGKAGFAPTDELRPAPRGGDPAERVYRVFVSRA